jgi:DNA polymerase epsilon subunit 1
MLPATFPENYGFKLKNGKKLAISYPCVMLNHLVHDKFTNHQYQTLVDKKTFKYETHSDNSIFFEVDGPYRAMILPTSKEEDKNLKKRYAVFNDDGSLAELKGFEVKRRGELKLIKIFQQQIFKFFLEGTTLAETYAAVAKVANQWLDVLHSKGETLADEELIDLICENRSMSKTLEEYGTQKSTSITTAKRLADFLGEQMVKDKGLNCKYIICSRPKNAPVTERAIPVAIFSAETSVKRYFLRKWLKEDPTNMDPRALLDWDYYLERLGSVIQKLITIPAALQKVRNPVPRVAHPDWLQRRINVKDDKLKQKKMTDLFKSAPLDDITNLQDPRAADMEDFGVKLLKPKTVDAAISQASQKAQKRKSPEPAVAVSVNPYAALPEKMPVATKDYAGFLDYQKQKWKIQKLARIRRRHLFGESRVGAANNIGETFRNQAEMTFRSTWQVLQLRATSSPGIVMAYVLIDSKIHAIKVNVPRQVFLNLKGKELPDIEVDGCEAQKVTHTLPNGHPSVHLFKLTMSEDVYVNDAPKISLLFNHPSVEGVYEKNVPLSVRAVLQLGSLCTFDETQPGVLGKGLESGFDLSSLKRAATKQLYLSQSPMAYLFLYHVVAGDRQVFAIFSTAKETAHVVILQKSKDSAQDLPNIGKIYTEMFTRRVKEADEQGRPWQNCFKYQEKMQFKTSQVTTRRKALLEIGDLIKKMKNEESNPLILVIQSPHRRMLIHDVPILGEFPVLPLRHEIADSNLPPLGWQAFVAKRLVNHYLSLGTWILHLTELARYGDVPLCNLERDDPRYLIDIAYARRLQKNNVVLWWSGGSRPDHAGYEEDDVLGPLDTVQMPSVNNPGTYPSVCIEIDVRNLAINTILTSSLINELEGSDSIAFNPAAPQDDSPSDGTNILYSDSAFATAGVTVLREMVKAWWTEACRGSSMADIMVQHLVRWVENPDSFLYDRSLHYYVQMMSRKAFQQLMTDFRRVGSHVVFANANRLLLQTTKSEVGNAYAYSQYILKSIKAKPLFHFLDLEIKEYWDYLVWYDEFNYGGKGCSEVVEAEKQTLDCIMHWQLSKFLPAPMQPIFHDWVVEFVEVMHKMKRPRAIEGIESTPRATQLPIHALGNDKEDKIILGKEFEKPLKRQIAGLIRRQKDEMLHPELASDYSFPVLPGSHLKLENPALQLVKSLMQVLSLDKNITMEARLLRKELLAMFEIREFSKEARFENPSESLRIQQVICNNCTMARDLDFCRDEELIPIPSATSSTPDIKPWKCSFCDVEYNRLEIEERLIAEVQKLVVEWNTQDLKCGKCGGLRVNDFMEHCACSGQWGGVVKRDEVVRRLKVFGRVASSYGLRMLGVVVDEVMGGV